MESINLILKHLFECEVLDIKEAGEEILPILSHDAASTISVLTVSSFDSNCELRDLKTTQKIEWIFQTISYCLTLPSLYEESITKTMQIFQHWLHSDNFFCDSQTKNEYARRIITHCSSVFDYTKDNTFPDVRTKLILFLIHNLDFSESNNNSWFDNDTHDLFIRVLIGCSDFLCTKEATTYFGPDNQRKILSKIYQVLFDSICKSNLRTNIWQLFTKFCKKWSFYRIFLSSWRQYLIQLYENILNSLLTKTPNEISRFHLLKFIHAIDLDLILSKKELFDELGKTVNNLHKKCINSGKLVQSTSIPLFPAETFFSLFGAYIFKPFESDDLNSCHARILKTVFRITENFFIPENSQWTKLLMMIFAKSFKSENPQIKESVLMHSNHLLNNRNKFGMQLLNQLYNQVEQFKLTTEIKNPMFWLNYSLILTEMCETKSISESALTHCFNNSSDLNAKFNILNIEARYNIDLFFKHFLQLYSSNYLAISTLNLMLASYLPFIDLPNILDILKQMLSIVIEHQSVRIVVTTFIIFVSQLAKYSDAVYDSSFSQPFLEFLVTLSYEWEPEKLRSRYLAKIMNGRSVKSQKKMQNPLKTFLVGGSALISFNDDEFEVRDSRGRFNWSIDPLYLQKNYQKQIDPKPISTTDSVTYKVYESHYKSPFDNIQSIIDQISQKLIEDQKIDHKEKSYVQNQKEYDGSRNKFINFIVETGLYQELKELEEPVNEVIEKFDSIPDVKLFVIPLINFNNQSKLYDYFESLMNVGKIINLGLIDLNFVCENVETPMISIIFNESPFDIKDDNLMSKSNLTFIVQPFDENRFLLSATAKDVNFWSNLQQKRIVSKHQLLMTICITIFIYVATVKPRFLYETETERHTYIQGLKSKPISLIDLVK